MIQNAISGGFMRSLGTEILSTSGSLINSALYSCTNYEIDKTSIPKLRETYEGPDLYEWRNFPGSYNYTLDGTGVDYVLIGLRKINPFHYDFYDIEGNSSRLNTINWGEYLGLDPIYYSEYFNPDYHYFPDIQAVENSYTSSIERNYGHDMMVLSIGAGRIYGWAKNAQIYYFREIDVYTSYDIVRRFHESKSIDPNTGFKRPTICVESHASLFSLSDFANGTYNILGIHYSGSYHEGAIPSLEYGFPLLPLNNTDLNNLYGKSVVVNDPIRTGKVQDMTDAGVIHIKASMNNSMPIYRANLTESVPYNIPERYRSIHYDNYISYSGGVYGDSRLYYHRPTSNTSWDSLEVGITSVYPYSSSFNLGPNAGIVISSSEDPNSLDSIEWPNYIGNIGGGTDILAPGEGIVGAYNQYYGGEGGSYYNNSPYLPNIGRAENPADTIVNPNIAIHLPILGTSWSAPQVAGVACLYFQLNPGATAQQFKQFLLDHSKPVRRSPTEETGVIDNWAYKNRIVEGGKTYPVLYGAPTAALFWPYSSPNPAIYSNIQITTS